MDTKGYITIYHDQTSTKLPISKKIIIISVAILILIVAIIICVNIAQNLLVGQPSNIVEITNYNILDQQPPSATKANLSDKLYQILSQHFDTPTTPRSIKGIIRSGTVQNHSSDSQYSDITFILDIDDYQQSYLVGIAWPSQDIVTDDSSINCVTRDLSKYPGVPCYDIYNNTTAVHSFLPYEGTLSSDQTFTASYGFEDNSGFEHLTVTIQDCGDVTLKDAAVDAVKTYLKSAANLNPEDYIYQKVSDNTNCN